MRKKISLDDITLSVEKTTGLTLDLFKSESPVRYQGRQHLSLFTAFCVPQKLEQHGIFKLLCRWDLRNGWNVISIELIIDILKAGNTTSTSSVKVSNLSGQVHTGSEYSDNRRTLNLTGGSVRLRGISRT
jgi:hypothetical protein